MRGVLTTAARRKPGDVVLDGDERIVQRTLGMQGRKPVGQAPKMRVVFDDGEVVVVREDTPVRVRLQSHTDRMQPS